MKCTSNSRNRLRTYAVIVMFIGAAALPALSGCGVYTFNPGGKSSIKSIAIAPFENKTVQLGLADQMTNDVIDAFIADGKLKVLPEANADAVLHGTLVSYKNAAYEYTGANAVQSYAVTMIFEISLTQSDGTEMWKQQMTQTGVYDLASETEEDGQRKALASLVQAVINRTTKSW